jgi:hypothetical protein
LRKNQRNPARLWAPVLIVVFASIFTCTLDLLKKRSILHLKKLQYNLSRQVTIRCSAKKRISQTHDQTQAPRVSERSRSDASHKIITREWLAWRHVTPVRVITVNWRAHAPICRQRATVENMLDMPSRAPSNLASFEFHG